MSTKVPADDKNVEEIKELERSELDKITNVELKTELAQCIIGPLREMREWDYSTKGEHFPVWIVARFPGHDLELAYSEFGQSLGDRAALGQSIWQGRLLVSAVRRCFHKLRAF